MINSLKRNEYAGYAVIVVLLMTLIGGTMISRAELHHARRQAAIDNLTVCLEHNRTMPINCSAATAAVEELDPSVVSTLSRIAEAKRDINELIHYLRVVN